MNEGVRLEIILERGPNPRRKISPTERKYLTFGETLDYLLPFQQAYIS